MTDWKASFAKYFEVRNYIWLHPESETALSVLRKYTSKRAMRQLMEQIALKHRGFYRDRKRLVRVHTNVGILQEESLSSTACRVRAEERVVFVSELAHDLTVESRIIRHNQLWSLTELGWKLEHTVESSEDEKQEVPRTALEPDDDSQDVRTLVTDPQRGYNRVAAIRYADLWWDKYNRAYPVLEDDCTNFISQCIHAGGIPMTHVGNKQRGWWAKRGSWSYSWTTSHALYQHVLRHVGGRIMPSAQELKMGDLIFYDWEGTGVFHHSTIITDFDEQGDPLVNAHTDASFHRPYRYMDSRAYTEATRYSFVHMPN